MPYLEKNNINKQEEANKVWISHNTDNFCNNNNFKLDFHMILIIIVITIILMGTFCGHCNPAWP